MYTVAIGAAVVAVMVLVMFSFLLSLPVMLLWNGCLITAVDGVHEITWLQAWGISLLFGLLFKTTTTTKDN
jgi:hypothetical protein